MRRSTLLRSLLAVVVGGTATAGHAALDLTGSMQALADASVATVVLVPPMAVFANPLNQTGLQTSGCHYTTADPVAIRTLVAILASSDVTANAVYQRPDMREGVYFAMAGGAKFSVLFADRPGSRLPLVGIAESTNGGQIQSTSVSAKASMSTDVRGWARRFGGVGTGTTCDLQSSTADDMKAPEPLPSGPTPPGPPSPSPTSTVR